MKYVMTLMLMSTLLLPCQAGQREDALLKGLLGFGAQVLDAQTAATPAAAAEAPAQPESSVPTPAAFPAVSVSAPSMSQMFIAPIRQTVDGMLEEYKEKYKEEGRAYAREVGDIVVERVVQDEEINSTITSLRVLCWFVVAYLTLVTFIMLACLVYLKHANARLLEQVRELCRDKHSN